MYKCHNRIYLPKGTVNNIKGHLTLTVKLAVRKSLERLCQISDSSCNQRDKSEQQGPLRSDTIYQVVVILYSIRDCELLGHIHIHVYSKHKRVTTTTHEGITNLFH